MQLHSFVEDGQKDKMEGGSPGLVVAKDDSCSRGCGFESRRHILDRHDIFHIELLWGCIVCLKRLSIN